MSGIGGRLALNERSRDTLTGARLQMPSLVGLGIEPHTREGRELQVFGERLIASIEAWRHVQRRRARGRRYERA